MKIFGGLRKLEGLDIQLTFCRFVSEVLWQVEVLFQFLNRY